MDGDQPFWLPLIGINWEMDSYALLSFDHKHNNNTEMRSY